jgi:sphingolipid 4-desaturase/C4-monooxygenase
MKKDPSPMELYNWLFVLIVDFLILRILGWNAIAFLAASMWFGYSYHPVAAHFIQEHYTFLDGQETYSYYGPLNTIFMNIGYHNEHHDLTGVPWRRLPLITALIPSFYYEKLSNHKSWPKVHWDFIMKDHLGPCSRVTRKGTGRIIKNE